MESLSSDNTQAVIKNFPVCAGKNKHTLHECKRKLRVCLSMYRKPVFKD